MTTSLRSSIAVPPSLLAAWCFGAAPAHPSDPKSNSLVAGADRTSLPLAAALRGGRAPSLASVIANGCFLTLSAEVAAPQATAIQQNHNNSNRKRARVCLCERGKFVTQVLSSVQGMALGSTNRGVDMIAGEVFFGERHCQS